MPSKKVEGRRSLYLRGRKDRDIIQYIESLMDKHDFTDIVRDLLRDGIAYRNREQVNVLQSNQITHTETTETFDDIKLTKKEVSEEEIKERIDGFFASF